MPIKPDRIGKITSNIGKASILILGDIMLDEYLNGTVSRISPEAPVPVVEVTEDQIRLGGAANVANNIRALGDTPYLMGTIGLDDAAIKLSQLLTSHNISKEFLIDDKDRCTTIKTRIIANNQQVVRADRENREEISAEIEKRILDRFKTVKDEIKAVIISDYGKGVITQSLLAKLIPACLERDIFIAVDPKDTHFFNYKKVSVVTPNHHEAGFVAGRRIRTEHDLDQVGRHLLEKLEAKSILITRGEKGMALFYADGTRDLFPTVAKKVFDVTGAGDTVIASFVSAVCAGADLKEAAIVSNCAAGVVVAEIGTATVTRKRLDEELREHFANGD
ncbi:MAG: D-glycero-beta-D-manno-heptose-7-phosphate kinase [candidate division Zixibacteria bacterium]|nr:D-glycero-beta-D-manno-heptose-7-phosphate kinase [candidate division Zixibacteria bacterium]